MKRIALLVSGCLLAASALEAAPSSPTAPSDIWKNDPGLTGSIVTDYWDEMTRSRLNIPSSTSAFGQLSPNGPQDPYHPGAIFLEYILAQNRPEGARLYRTAGSGNVAGVGLYDVGGMGLGLNLSPSDPIINMLMSGSVTHEYLASRTDITQETFTDPFQLAIRSDAMEDLSTVVFQIQIFGMAIKEGFVTPFEMTEMLFPVTLSINGTETELLPTFKKILMWGDYSGGGGTGGDEAAGMETWAFQWDLSGLEVDTFEIDFTVYPHSSVRGLRIDQSDTFTEAYAAVPEPSTWALLIGGGGWLLLRRRSRATQTKR